MRVKIGLSREASRGTAVIICVGRRVVLATADAHASGDCELVSAHHLRADHP